jgi:hypothetical protein
MSIVIVASGESEQYSLVGHDAINEIFKTSHLTLKGRSDIRESCREFKWEFVPDEILVSEDINTHETASEIKGVMRWNNIPLRVCKELNGLSNKTYTCLHNDEGISCLHGSLDKSKNYVVVTDCVHASLYLQLVSTETSINKGEIKGTF